MKSPTTARKVSDQYRGQADKEQHTHVRQTEASSVSADATLSFAAVALLFT